MPDSFSKTPATARPAGAAADRVALTKEERRVIFASSLGTVFEWYDFYLYATLAPFFAALFFPPGNDTAALLSAFATYAAGFLVRPFGALVFGRVGDLVGRKTPSWSPSSSWARRPRPWACCRPTPGSGSRRRSC
jgi:hypothetical protein